MSQGQMATTKQATSMEQRGGGGVTHPLVKLRKSLEMRKSRMESEMAKGINVDAQIGAAIQMVQGSSQLMNCTHESVISSVYEANRLGISLHPSQKQAYLVPFKRKAQLIIDYRGYLAKAISSGVLKDLDYDLVYEADHFQRRKKYVGNRNESLVEFEPREDLPLADRGPVMGVLVQFTLPDDTVKLAYMPRERIERTRAAAPSARGKSPWDTHWEEMAAKTAIKWAFKMIPMTVELADVVSSDDAYAPAIDVTVSVEDDFDPETGEVIEEETPEETKAETKAITKEDPPPAEDDGEMSKADRMRQRAAEI